MDLRLLDGWCDEIIPAENFCGEGGGRILVVGKVGGTIRIVREIGDVLLGVDRAAKTEVYDSLNIRLFVQHERGQVWQRRR